MIIAMIALNPSTTLATTVSSFENLTNKVAEGTLSMKLKSSSSLTTNILDTTADGGNITGDYEGICREVNGGPVYGGALLNQNGGEIGSITGDFTGNIARSIYSSGQAASMAHGGAIANLSSTIGDITGDFTGNIASVSGATGESYTFGAAIYNSNKSTIGNIKGNFKDNITKGGQGNYGGAIYNSASTIGDITGDFIKNGVDSSDMEVSQNHFQQGGAILNGASAQSSLNDNSMIGTISGDFTGNYAKSLGGSSQGGAIFNQSNDSEFSAEIEALKCTFSGNYTESVSGNAFGGAIYNNSATIGSITGNFLDNYTSSMEKIARGGAIYNAAGSIENITGLFKGNYADGFTKAAGGAIYNIDGTIVLTDSSFIDNYAQSATGSASGGAIYNNGGTVSINAINHDSVFSGNTIKKLVDEEWISTSNAIYNSGTLTFNATKDKNIIFYDAIDGAKGTININQADKKTATEDTSVKGTVIFNNTVTNQIINLYDGTLVMGSVKDEYGEYISCGDFDETVTLNILGGAINHQDNDARSMNVGHLTISENADVYLDADLASKVMDNYKIADEGSVTVTNGAQLNVKAINILSDGKNLVTTFDFTDNEELMAAICFTNQEDIQGMAPIFKYDISYDSTSGNFTFTRTEEVNPSILVTPAAAQIGAYMTQFNSFEQAFSNYDMITSLHNNQRQALYNQRAKTSKGNFWVRPYSSYGDVNYSNIASVDEFTYGTYAGVDSAVKELCEKWSMIYSAYAGYNGSEQKFDGVKVKQNGAIVGVSALLYKGNFWTSVTMNVGALSADAKTMYGDENFDMLTSGVAMKTGYNVELQDGDYILQPNVQFSYSYVNTEDHTNASGVAIKSDNLHAFQIAPGLRLISNLSQEWQPYLDLRMVWNLNDESSFTADGHALPDLSLDPYIEYGAGLQWHYSDNMRFNGAVMLRSGGRRGGSLNLGMSWSM